MKRCLKRADRTLSVMKAVACCGRCREKRKLRRQGAKRKILAPKAVIAAQVCAKAAEPPKVLHEINGQKAAGIPAIRGNERSEH